jgi:hypothetical protein
MAAMIGALLGLIGNLMHPRGSEFGARAEIALVNDSGIWLFDHFLIAWSFAFAIVGLVAIGWSFTDDVGQSWGRIATASAIGSVTIAFATIAVDGMAMEAAAATGGAVGEAVAHIGLAMFTATIGSLFGLTPVLFGVAILSSTTYPKGLGYLILAGGLLGMLVASVQFLSGPSTLVTNVLFVASSMLFTIWVFLMGWRLWSGVPAGAPTPAPAAGARV